jgi:hypothetical protein
MAGYKVMAQRPLAGPGADDQPWLVLAEEIPSPDLAYELVGETMRYSPGLPAGTELRINYVSETGAEGLVSINWKE